MKKKTVLVTNSKEEKDPNYISSCKWDTVFKNAICGEGNKDILKAIIEESLRRKIDEIEILNTEYEKAHPDEQGKRVDCLIKSGNELINIEINRVVSPAQIERNFRYLAGKHNLRFKDKETNKYQYAYSIQLNFNWGVTYENAVNKYVMINEKDINDVLPVKFEYYTFSMDQIAKQWYNVDGKGVDYKYLKTMTIEKRDELEEFTKGDPIMEKIAKNVLDINDSDIYKDILSWEEDEALIREADIYYATEDGKEIGAKENSVEIAKNMLKENCEIELICKVTGLDIETIEKLKSEM